MDILKDRFPCPLSLVLYTTVVGLMYYFDLDSLIYH